MSTKHPTLRLLNLLEPGKAVISITKVGMWISLILVTLVILVSLVLHVLERPPLDFGAFIAAISGFFGMSFLYAWRRQVQLQTGSPGLEPDPATDTASPVNPIVPEAFEEDQP